jgi:hypothetical protein
LTVSSKSPRKIEILSNLDDLDFQQKAIDVQQLAKLFEAKISDLGHTKTAQSQQTFIETVTKRARNARLDLRELALGPQAATILTSLIMAKNTNFVHFDLSNNNVGDTGTQNLHLPNHIVSLALGSNNLTTAGLRHLSERLRYNLSVVDLDLSNDKVSQYKPNRFGVEGCASLAGRVLKTNKILAFLNLYNC